MRLSPALIERKILCLITSKELKDAYAATFIGFKFTMFGLKEAKCGRKLFNYLLLLLLNILLLIMRNAYEIKGMLFRHLLDVCRVYLLDCYKSLWTNGAVSISVLSIISSAIV